MGIHLFQTRLQGEEKFQKNEVAAIYEFTDVGNASCDDTKVSDNVPRLERDDDLEQSDNYFGDLVDGKSSIKMFDRFSS